VIARGLPDDPVPDSFLNWFLITESLHPSLLKMLTFPTILHIPKSSNPSFVFKLETGMANFGIPRLPYATQMHARSLTSQLHGTRNMAPQLAFFTNVRYYVTNQSAFPESDPAMTADAVRQTVKSCTASKPTGLSLHHCAAQVIDEKYVTPLTIQWLACKYYIPRGKMV